jgi:hypothetical protein
MRTLRKKNYHKKTIRKYYGGKVSASLSAFESNIACKFLEMLNTIKLYHWKTHSYATHKATDELYVTLGEHIDKFIETLLGKEQNRIKLRTKHIALKNITNEQEFKREINGYKTFLVGLNNNKTLNTSGMTNSDLFSIRDEILGDLNQFLYLSTFK